MLFADHWLVVGTWPRGYCCATPLPCSPQGSMTEDTVESRLHRQEEQQFVEALAERCVCCRTALPYQRPRPSAVCVGAAGLFASASSRQRMISCRVLCCGRWSVVVVVVVVGNRSLVVTPMTKDGNCLFRCVAHQIWGDPERHREVIDCAWACLCRWYCRRGVRCLVSAGAPVCVSTGGDDVKACACGVCVDARVGCVFRKWVGPSREP